MKKLFMLMLVSMYSSFCFAQISEKEQRYMLDLHYIENQAFENKRIEDHIKRQPILADYFAVAIKKNEIVLVPYANNSSVEVKNIIEGWKSTLKYDNVHYENEPKYGNKKVKVHLIYTQKPKWVTSNIFD